MKKLIVYSMTVLISASIPIYFLLIWEPLKAKDVIGSDISYNNLNEENSESIENHKEVNLKIQNENFFNNFDNIILEKREKLNQVINNLAIEDIIKINNYFRDLNNKESINKGIELAKKRMTKRDFEEFKGIIKEFIEFE